MSDYSIGEYESFSGDNEVGRAAFWKAIYFKVSEMSVQKEMVCQRKQGNIEVKMNLLACFSPTTMQKGYKYQRSSG